jgi:purine-cytosine permease-like protein
MAGNAPAAFHANQGPTMGMPQMIQSRAQWLYFLVPWTAVNLVDFYFVRHGHYAIMDIFDPRGIYHRWAWRGLTAYFAGLAAMIPFVSPTFFQGPVTKALGGADVSFAVGLTVAAVLYYMVSRSLDLGPELEAEQRSRNALLAGTHR